MHSFNSESVADLHGFLLVLVEQHQVVGDDVTDVQVNDPVHEVETHKTNGEHNPRVFVNVAGGDAVQLADVLAGVQEVRGRGRRTPSAALFVRPSVHRVFQGAAF
jgi:hypothetical protein